MKPTLHTLAQRIVAALAGMALGLGPSGAAAAEAVVAVVSAKNPIGSLSKPQIADIFMGKANRFPDGNPAVPIDQAEGSAARDGFYLGVAGKSPAQVKAHWSKIIFTGRGQPPKELADGNAVKKYLAAHPNAIGYLEQSQVDGSVKVLSTP
jgi:ABC-type phosphate transport system substrate-binding protein